MVEGGSVSQGFLTSFICFSWQEGISSHCSYIINMQADGGFLGCPEPQLPQSRAACHMVRGMQQKKRAEGVSAENWVTKIVGS